MALPVELVLAFHTLISILSAQGVRAIKADHMGSYGPAFYQSYDASGQFTHEFDGEQIFSVDLKNREVVWRLPEFGDILYSDFQSGLTSIAMIRAHLDILVERSNRTRAISVPPRVTVLPKSRVELGKPNVLICIVDDIFPPVINVTWLCNNQPITQGVAQTSFYSQPNHRFRKFHYLTFVPSEDDMYDCRVEHWGLDEPLLQHWEPQVLTPPPDTMETLVCSLGLALGFMGFLLGTILIITGMRLTSGHSNGKIFYTQEEAIYHKGTGAEHRTHEGLILSPGNRAGTRQAIRTKPVFLLGLMARMLATALCAQTAC